MTDQVAKVKKTGYKSKAVKGRNAAADKVHVVRRTLADFPAPRRVDDGVHMIGDSVKLLKAVYRSGTEFGLEGEFALALPGEYGTYQGDTQLPSRGLVFKNHAMIKLLHCTAYLVDDGSSFEWI